MKLLKRLQHGRESEHYYCRFTHHGKLVWKNTGQYTQVEALAWATRFRRELISGQSREALAAVSQRQASGCAVVLTAYLAAGCPDRQLRSRLGRALEEHQRLLGLVAPWWSAKNPADLTQADCDDYRTYRRAAIAARHPARARQGGDRTIELELQALSDALTWAVRTRRLAANPIARRQRYVNRRAIRHSRVCMPGSGDELHRIAAHLFQDPRSEVHAWCYLLEALTGLRTSEARALRADATHTPQGTIPGWQDDRYLYVERKKRGTNPRVRLDDPDRSQLALLLQRIRRWHAVRFPDSPWLLPGRAGAQLTEGTLTHALGDTVRALSLVDAKGQPVVRTSHGARAYYASVRLAQGQTPEDVARELGQRSGDALVRDIYGVEPDDYCADHWTSLARVLTWSPSTLGAVPAWDTWQPRPVVGTAPDNIIHLEAAAGI